MFPLCQSKILIKPFSSISKIKTNIPIMSQEEQTPLLPPQSSRPTTPIDAFPPFSGDKPKTPPPYEAVEIPPESDNSPKKGWCRVTNGLLFIILIAAFTLLIAAVIYLLYILFYSTADPQATLAHNLQKRSIGDKLKEANSEYIDLTIPQGRLRGFTKKSRQGRDYTAYFKVPYAEPPLEELRFKDPIAPRAGWEGLRIIEKVAPQCIQQAKYSDVVEAAGEEDCLYSNIYVPNILEGEDGKVPSLPVMVYIHGGGLVDGNGSRYGPDYFMDEDVILLNFQYRLGPFGFLNTGDDVIHGNMGFKDQIQMLKWTKENAIYFGGDPNRVTIFGNSAGAASVSFLMLSPMATGLFERAITQSGANVCGGSIGMLDLEPSKTVHEVGRVLNCNSYNTTEFLECLRTKTAEEIALVRTAEAVYTNTIENRNDSQVFMPDTPYNMLKNGRVNRVPYIIGVVNSEWASLGIMMVQDEDIRRLLNNNFELVAGEMLGVDLNEEDLLKIKEFYFGEKEIGNETLSDVVNMMSDSSFIHCSYVSANMHSLYSPTYLYILSKPPYLSYIEKAVPGFPAKEMGFVSHADELQFLFLYYGYPEIVDGDQEYFEFSSYVVNQWTTFAANGAPTSDWQPALDQSSNSTFWFDLNDVSGRADYVKERMDFWDGFTHKQLRYDV